MPHEEAREEAAAHTDADAGPGTEPGERASEEAADAAAPPAGPTTTTTHAAAAAAHDGDVAGEGEGDESGAPALEATATPFWATEFDPNCKLFVGGLAWSTTSERLREFFGQFGPVRDAVIMRDKVSNRSRGFGFVLMQSAEDATRATANPHVLDGRPIEAKPAVPREAMPRSEAPHARKLFIGALPLDMSEDAFLGYFAQFGSVTECLYMRDRASGAFRGFGFVTYASEDVAKTVLDTKHVFQEREAEVKRAEPKRERASSRSSPSTGAAGNSGPGTPGGAAGLAPSQAAYFAAAAAGGYPAMNGSVPPNAGNGTGNMMLPGYASHAQHHAAYAPGRAGNGTGAAGGYMYPGAPYMPTYQYDPASGMLYLAQAGGMPYGMNGVGYHPHHPHAPQHQQQQHHHHHHPLHPHPAHAGHAQHVGHAAGGGSGGDERGSEPLLNPPVMTSQGLVSIPTSNAAMLAAAAQAGAVFVPGSSQSPQRQYAHAAQQHAGTGRGGNQPRGAGSRAST